MSHATNRRLSARGIVFLSAILLSVSLAIADESLPRFQLLPGQELSYRGKNEFKYEKGKLLTRETWKIWVVRANPNGGWRLVLRHGTRFSQVRDEESKKFSEGFTPAEEEPESVSFAWCDLQPDGTIEVNDSLGLRLDPQNLLPRLPTTAAEARSGWKIRNDRMDQSDIYRLREVPADGKCTIDVVRESPMEEIYGSESRRVVTFDLKRGIPEKIASESRQTYGFNGRGEGSVDLVEEQSHPAEWVQQFAEDAEKYFSVESDYKKTIGRKDLSADDLKSALEDSLKAIQRTGEELQTPELRKLLEDQSKQREQTVNYVLEQLAERASLIGTPSEEWTTTDLAGNPHALKDYRGKVVILDFWYRGCGWCIRAMPQMKQVAAHFEGQPVVVFGMNTDRNEEDALFVVEKMGLSYPNLKATGLPEKYKVHGFPTLLILDQEGVIRDIHVGYSPTLREEVVKSVEGLLGKK